MSVETCAICGTSFISKKSHSQRECLRFARSYISTSMEDISRWITNVMLVLDSIIDESGKPEVYDMEDWDTEERKFWCSSGVDKGQ